LNIGIDLLEKIFSLLLWTEPNYAGTRPGDIIYLDIRKWRWKHSFADIEEIKSKLNFKTLFTFIEGLKLITN